MATMNIARSASHAIPTHKRMRFADSNRADGNHEGVVPAPAYQDSTLRRTKSMLMPHRLMRRLTNKQESYLDSDTIPVLTKREQRKAEKRERRRLDELQAYQRKQFHDQISRQLEVNQCEREPQHTQPTATRSVRQKVRDTLRRGTKSTRRPDTQLASYGALPSPGSCSQCPPHVNDFQNKNQLQQWFHGPSDVEATPAPVTITEAYPAELPAIDVASPYQALSNDFAKKQFGGSLDIETLPPLMRSPSPCLSSLPQRGMTINEIPQALSSKLMKCDSCYDAIKMTGFHYACNVCNDGDCLYCGKCANGGRTCRHELFERTRNIKRHPSNPQSSFERKSLSFDKDSVISSEAHIELSATHPHSILPPLDTKFLESSSSQASSSKAQTPPAETAVTPTDMFRDFENKRREQEMTFREKEVTLREREAMLREREAWTASRERDAALVQQLHAAAMLSQRAEVGSQFSPRTPISRQSSYYKSSLSDYTQSPGGSDSVCRQSSHSVDADGIILHALQKGKKPNIELASSVAAIEASIAGLEIADSGCRMHGNSTKRKASSEESKSQASRSSSNKSQANSNRTTNRKRIDDPTSEDEEDGESTSPKRQKQESSDEPQKLFACPYYKHDPVRYAEGNTGELHYRGCAGGLYRDISRVKQHLKRIHHRPDHYCRRCFEIFDSSDKLQKHSSSRQGCDVKDCPYPEKLNETQQGKIHVKRPGKDPKDLWFEIFSIIFPGSPQPESPYIEQAQPTGAGPEMLNQFVEMFNRRLDLSNANHPWLNSPSIREFLSAQMWQTLRDMQSFGSAQTPAVVPPIHVSPISPPNANRSRQSSYCSSRASSAKPQNHRHRAPSSGGPSSMLSPISAQSGLRPALKVTTHGMGSESSSGGSASDSARSQRNHSFPKIPTHVREDSGYDNSESWASGDDIHVMGNVTNQEPASATSTRSTKSVSFASHPQPMEDWDNTMNWLPSEQNTGAPNLFDFAASDWSSYNFASTNIPVQRPSSKNKATQRADSAYGTLSSAQASRTSLSQPQPYVHLSQEHLTCVDPSKLFVNALESNMSSGLSADVQAYFNRDMNGYFDGI